MSGVISTPVQIGVGDGATTTFDLVPNPGEEIAQVVIANVWRNDWQGNQLLYPTPRTNIVLFSQDFTQSIWNKTNSSITTNATQRRTVSPQAMKLVENTASSSHLLRQPKGFTVGQNYTITMIAKGGGAI